MDKMLRILHVFSTFAVGGPQRRFVDLANSLTGYHHIIASCDGQYQAENLLSINAEYEICDFELIKSRAVNATNLQRVKALFKKYQPDLLCTYNFGTMEVVLAHQLFARSKIRHLHFEDGFGPEESQTVQLKRRVLFRQLLLKNKPIIVPSATLKNVATDIWKMDASNICHIDNGVDLELYTQKPDQQKNDPLIIGTVGAFRAEKNLPLLIDAFAASGLKDKAKLVLVGDGPEMPRLVAHAQQKGVADQTVFEGYQADPKDYYTQFDIFALTSDTEQMPLSILEAMASALPIVSTNVGDIAKMLPEISQIYLHPAGDTQGLSHSLHDLCISDALRLETGTENRKKAETSYDRQDMLRNYDRLFRDK